MRLALILCLTPLPGLAESLVTTRTIKALSVIEPADVTLVEAEIPEALTLPDLAVGMEARVTIYAGRPVLAGDVGPPALVERNQIVALAFQTGTLEILTEGRALERGAAGDLIRVMNLASRNTVSGLIGENGQVRVSP